MRDTAALIRTTSSSNASEPAIFTPEELRRIDNKLDDGKSFSRIVYTMPESSTDGVILPNCTMPADGNSTKLPTLYKNIGIYIVSFLIFRPNLMQIIG